MIVAIIPARGGSKRIPHKNVKNFLGVPIIKYSIDAAIQSGCFDEIMVSTDNHEIAEKVQTYGAIVPFYRSEKNADDHASLADVIAEVLQYYKAQGKKIDAFCCILATAPFILPERLRQGFSLLTEHHADAVVPVVQYSYPIQRSLKIEDGQLEMVWPENYRVRSQDLEFRYHDSGQFYWMKTDSFLEQGLLFAKKTIPLIVPETEVQDIDTYDDWQRAELKYTMLQGTHGSFLQKQGKET